MKYEKLNNSKLLIYSDENYSKAINYTQHLYNFPITLNFGDKHNRTKYIIGAGNQDSIDLYKDGCFIYILTENTGLNYVGIEILNTETKEIEDSIFFQGDNADECMELPTDEYKIKFLLQYAAA